MPPTNPIGNQPQKATPAPSPFNFDARIKITDPKRGEIYLANFDPTLGAEINKTRPALILQNDIANRHSPITIVAAITSQFKAPLYPAQVLIKATESGLPKDSVVLLDQVRSIDKIRLIKRLGSLMPVTMQQVEQVLQASFGLVKP